MTDVVHHAASTPPPISSNARAVRTIVALAAALFFVQLTVLAPADVEAAMGFSSRDLGHRWWTVGTFTLVHADFWLLVVNLTAIGVFGGALERSWGTGEFIRYYAACSLGAWIAHVTFVSGDITLTGAAAPAAGSVLAYAALTRDAKHFRIGSVAMSSGRLAALVTIAILTAGITAAPPAQAAAYLVHAAGLVAGWVYLGTASSINFVRFRDAVSPVLDEPEDMPPRAIPRGQFRAQRGDDEIVASSNAAVAREAVSRRAVSPPLADGREANPLNQLLDKISAHGIESLTPDERRLLDNVSRRLRDH